MTGEIAQRSAGARLRHAAWLVLGAVVALALTVGGAPGWVALQPDPARFQAVIFKEPFIGFAALSIAWLIHLQRDSPQRARECRFLQSLPLSPGTVADRLAWADVVRSGWVLALTPLAYLVLLDVAPLPYLCRLLVLTTCSWLLTAVLNVMLQLGASLATPSRTGYPARYASAGVAVALFVYVSCQIAMLAWPQLISGAAFWVFLGACLLSIALLQLGNRALFRRWLAGGLQHARADRADSPVDRSAAPLLEAGWLGPMVGKSVLRGLRGARVGAIAPVAGALWLGYLLAGNNADFESRAWVLLGLFTFYALFHVYLSIGHFSPEHESRQLVYALPVHKRDVYLSIVTPALIGPSIAALAYVLLLFLAGSGVWIPLRFGLLAGVIAASLAAAATNFALGAYPRPRSGQRRLLAWAGCLVLASAAASRYVPWVAAAMVGGSFLALQGTRLFGRTQTGVSG